MFADKCSAAATAARRGGKKEGEGLSRGGQEGCRRPRCKPARGGKQEGMRRPPELPVLPLLLLQVSLDCIQLLHTRAAQLLFSGGRGRHARTKLAAGWGYKMGVLTRLLAGGARAKQQKQAAPRPKRCTSAPVSEQTPPAGAAARRRPVPPPAPLVPHQAAPPQCLPRARAGPAGVRVGVWAQRDQEGWQGKSQGEVERSERCVCVRVWLDVTRRGCGGRQAASRPGGTRNG